MNALPVFASFTVNGSEAAERFVSRRWPDIEAVAATAFRGDRAIVVTDDVVRVLDRRPLLRHLQREFPGMPCAQLRRRAPIGGVHLVLLQRDELGFAIARLVARGGDA